MHKALDTGRSGPADEMPELSLNELSFWFTPGGSLNIL